MTLARSYNVKLRINYDEFTSNLRQLDENLKTAVNRSVKYLAKLLKSEIIKNAPKKTGALRKGVNFRKISKGYRVSSGVNKGFPYHFWINQRPIRTIRAKWLGYQPIRYGGSGMRITGKPRYFDIATNKINQESAKILQNFANQYNRV